MSERICSRHSASLLASVRWRLDCFRCFIRRNVLARPQLRPGAISDRPGLCHQAHLGTLFLDEIVETPIDLQTRLVHVLAEREVHRVGSSKGEHVDVRIIASTSADVDEALEQGRLSRDLHHLLAAAESTG